MLLPAWDGGAPGIERLHWYPNRFATGSTRSDGLADDIQDTEIVDVRAWHV